MISGCLAQHRKGGEADVTHFIITRMCLFGEGSSKKEQNRLPNPNYYEQFLSLEYSLSNRINTASPNAYFLLHLSTYIFCLKTPSNPNAWSFFALLDRNKIYRQNKVDHNFQMMKTENKELTKAKSACYQPAFVLIFSA